MNSSRTKFIIAIGLLGLAMLAFVALKKKASSINSPANNRITIKTSIEPLSRSQQKSSTADDKISQRANLQRKTPRPSPDEQKNRDNGWILDKYGSTSYNLEKFSTLSPDYKLTLQSIHYAGLNPEEATNAQALFNDHRQRVLDLIRDNFFPTDATAEGVIAEYQIKSFPSEGSSEFEDFVGKLDSSLGEERRNKLLSGYSVFGQFFKYGNNNARVRIIQNPSLPEGVLDVNSTVEITTFDVTGGSTSGSQSMSLGIFESLFGDLISTEAEPDN